MHTGAHERERQREARKRARERERERERRERERERDDIGKSACFVPRIPPDATGPSRLSPMSSHIQVVAKVLGGARCHDAVYLPGFLLRAQFQCCGMGGRKRTHARMYIPEVAETAVQTRGGIVLASTHRGLRHPSFLCLLPSLCFQFSLSLSVSLCLAARLARPGHISPAHLPLPRSYSYSCSRALVHVCTCARVHECVMCFSPGVQSGVSSIVRSVVRSGRWWPA